MEFLEYVSKKNYDNTVYNNALTQPLVDMGCLKNDSSLDGPEGERDSPTSKSHYINSSITLIHRSPNMQNERRSCW